MVDLQCKLNDAYISAYKGDYFGFGKSNQTSSHLKKDAARQAVDGRFKSSWFQDIFFLTCFSITDRSIDLIYWV